MRYPSGPLRERNFLFLFIGQSVSGIGNAVVPIALTFALLDLTHSAADLGYVLGTRAIAQVVFLLVGGVIADRLPRRAVMLISDVVRVAAEAVLAILLLTGRPTVYTIGLLAFVQGAAAAAFLPASTALVPSVVRPENLQRANQLQQVGTAAAGIAGPALAGVLVVTASPGWAILLDAVSFGVSVVLLVAMRIDGLPRPARRHFLTDLREGWGEFRSRNWLWPTTIAFSFVNLLIGAYGVIGPLASQRYFGGAAAWATVSTVGGVGSVAGGLLTVRLKPKHPLRVGLCAAVVVGSPPLAFAAGFPIPVIALAAAISGTGVIVYLSCFNSTIQRHVPERSLSRVSSYTWFGAGIAYPLGPMIAGPAASVFSLRATLFVVGSLLILAIAPLMFVRSIWNLTDVPPPPRRLTGRARGPSAERIH